MTLAAIKETARTCLYAFRMKVERLFSGNAVAANLTRLMERREWSQSELSRKSGVSQTHIGAIIRGETECSVEIAAKLAEPFGKTAWHLFIVDLPSDLLHSEDLTKLFATYLEASPVKRHLIDAAADLARSTE